jgi:hypothetical protein
MFRKNRVAGDKRNFNNHLPGGFHARNQLSNQWEQAVKSTPGTTMLLENLQLQHADVGGEAPRPGTGEGTCSRHGKWRWQHGWLGNPLQMEGLMGTSSN